MKKLIEKIVTSIHMKPTEWRLTDGAITHRSGVRVWWSKSTKEDIPQAGNMCIETTGNAIHLSRFVTASERDLLWKVILDCELAKELVDEEILNIFEKEK